MQQSHKHKSQRLKWHSHQLIVAYKPQYHAIAVEQAEKRTRQMDPSFPYLERASEKPRLLSYKHHSFRNRSEELKGTMETIAKRVITVNPN